MSGSSSSGKINFEFGFGSAPAGVQRDPDKPFRILVLADFSGRGARGVREALGTRRLRPVDIDNLESVLAGFGAALNLPEGTIKFESLDDFHPDQLLKNLPASSELLTARRLLRAPATAAQGARVLERLLGAQQPPPETPSPGAAAAGESTDETLSRLLGSAPTTASPAPKAGGGVDIQALIKNIVGATSSAPAAPAGLPGLTSAVDLELSARLRAILHQPAFQALESAWRALDWLVRRCPDEERIKFLALDASMDELAADLASLHRLLRDQPPDLLVGTYAFGAGLSDLAALGGLARTCASLNSRCLAGAHPQLAGCDSFGLHSDPDDWRLVMPAEVRQAWQALRTAPEASRMGLALPRFLLRQPYGTGSERIDSFDFEEVTDPAAHETFLWGNSAFLCAQLLSEAFTAAGEEMDFAGGGTVGELPVFRFKEQGESAMKPCAEGWLTDRAADALLQQGLIPCLSVRGCDAVQVAGLQSIVHRG
jgi:type VI secretion system protein ImpC